MLYAFPEDVLTIIFSFCEPKDFLAICQTCRGLYDYRQDPLYWRTCTSETFRLPISPLLKADGPRWYYLYKRLKQTKLFTWGQGVRGNLGRGLELRRGRGRGPHPANPRFRTYVPPQTSAKAYSFWPTNTHTPEDVKVIADLQCGGWSTSILSSDGKVYVTGSINSMNNFIGQVATNFTQLHFPSEKETAVRQFSSGRFHILAMTDGGDILTWDQIGSKGLKVRFGAEAQFAGRPSRVVAGWGESSAYVPEVGIIYWTPVLNNQQDKALDDVQVQEKIIPGTARFVDGEDTGIEVVSHIVLEGFIVWVTSESRVYACSTDVRQPIHQAPALQPFEVPGYTSSSRFAQDVQGQYIKFAVFTNSGEVLAGNVDYLRRCGVQARSHPSPTDHTQPAHYSSWSGLEELISGRPQDVPALQHSQVISLAFGDHHYHALHANGTITSLGHEPESCGAMGFGRSSTGSRFRGLKTATGIGADSKLIPAAAKRGRKVWFEPEKRDWLTFMESTLAEGHLDKEAPAPAHGHRSALDYWRLNETKEFMFSEWVEQEGKHWNDGPIDLATAQNRLAPEIDSSKTTVTEDFHLDPYFAVSIAAAGWHSGALVLHDEERAQTTREKWIAPIPIQNEAEAADEAEMVEKFKAMPGHFHSEPSSSESNEEDRYIWKIQGFPKVELPDGSSLPGQGEFRPWREGKPSMAELGL